MKISSTVSIGGRAVGEGHPAYIIAEIGSNHDCSLDRAKELVKACRDAGADAVKFQSFTAQGLLNPLKKEGDGAWARHPAYALIEKLTLPVEWHFSLMEYCKEVGVTFLSAPFEEGRVELLEKIGVPAFKIASGDLTHDELLRKAASYNKPVILSTGASYMAEVKRAVEVIKSAGNGQIALLHCSALYPPAFDDVNLRSMVALKDEFGLPVGFSDHTPGSTVPVAAVALGGCMIEKHVTFSRNLPGPDHPYAMEIGEFKAMVDDIRSLEKALGDGVKRPCANEMAMRVIARRSVYAASDIGKGVNITRDMLKVVRHAVGIEPKDLDRVVGKTARNAIKKDMPVYLEDVCL